MLSLFLQPLPATTPRSSFGRFCWIRVAGGLVDDPTRKGVHVAGPLLLLAGHGPTLPAAVRGRNLPERGNSK